MRDQLIIGAAVGVLAAVSVPRTAAISTAAPTGTVPSRWLSGALAGACAAPVAAALAWRHPPRGSHETLLLTAWLIFTVAGLSLAWIDVVLQRLPTRLIVGAAAAITLVLSVAAAMAGRPAQLLVPVLAGAVLGCGYTALVAVGASRMGMGDVRLAALTGLLLGTGGWATLLLGAVLPYVLSLPIAVAALYRQWQTGDRKPLPFGPFLIAAAIIADLLTGVWPHT